MTVQQLWTKILYILYFRISVFSGDLGGLFALHRSRAACIVCIYVYAHGNIGSKFWSLVKTDLRQKKKRDAGTVLTVATQSHCTVLETGPNPFSNPFPEYGCYISHI